LINKKTGSSQANRFFYFQPFFISVVLLRKAGWVPIDSQDIGCAMFVEAYSWRNETYYALGSQSMYK
jgi:hypothetical protein